MKMADMYVRQKRNCFTVYNLKNKKLGLLLFPEDGRSLMDVEALNAICEIITKRWDTENKTD